MTQPTVATAKGKGATKPRQPRPDFPFYLHAVGKWAKTLRGKTRYLGTWNDPEGAPREYLDQKDALHAGRASGVTGDATVRQVRNAFLRAKRVGMDAGRLSTRYFR